MVRTKEITVDVWIIDSYDKQVVSSTARLALYYFRDIVICYHAYDIAV